MQNILVHISSEALSITEAYEFILNPASGGNCLFVGTVRDLNLEKQVSHLEFEAYEAMALNEMNKIAERAVEIYDIERICLFHRVGHVALMDAAVIIACASKHRDACFKASRFAIDELKKAVPIWKKEFTEDGNHWVSSTP